ncbi:MAG TPA: helix-turn-helix transcriptional regulator [Pirellulales bacterium]|nr:helix-turn-helix transcriptional regulator [Pirellulales bacterium]
MRNRSSSARHILAANLRCIRKSKGFSQESLAENAGLHRTFVGAVERSERNVSIDNIERLAIALGISVSDLLRERQSRGGDR